MTDPILLGMDDTSLAQICGEMFCHSSQTIIFQLLLARGDFVALPPALKYSKGSAGSKSGDKPGQVIVSSFFSSLKLWFDFFCSISEIIHQKLLSCQVSWDWESWFHSVFEYKTPHTFLVYLWMSTPLQLLHSCSPILANSHLRKGIKSLFQFKNHTVQELSKTFEPSHFRRYFGFVSVVSWGVRLFADELKLTTTWSVC